MTSKLETILSTVNGATFISMDTCTTPILTGGKKNPMQGRVRKHNTGANIMVFQNKNSNGYANMVKRRLGKEGKDPVSFNLSPRKWGTRIPNLPIVEHKGAQYLEVIYLKSGRTAYTLDGQPIDKNSIEGLKDSPKPSQGGLNDGVTIRTFKVGSITRLKVGGKEYNTVDLID
jgi:hypothetical protein